MMDTGKGGTEERKFIVSDISLCGFLMITLEVTPDIRLAKSHKVFLFPKEEKTFRARDSYYAGGTVPALQYSLIIKRLRDVLFRGATLDGPGEAGK